MLWSVKVGSGTKTRNYLFRRLAEANEIANAVVFPASDAASFITGQTLSTSGGYHMM